MSERMIGDVRCSMAEQHDGGLGLAAQRRAIELECQRRGWQLVRVETDVASGKSTTKRYLHLVGTVFREAADRLEKRYGLTDVYPSMYPLQLISRDRGRRKHPHHHASSLS